MVPETNGALILKQNQPQMSKRKFVHIAPGPQQIIGRQEIQVSQVEQA